MSNLFYKFIFNLSIHFPLKVRLKLNEDLDHIRNQYKKPWEIIWIVSIFLSTIVSVLAILAYDANIITSMLLIPFASPIIPLFAAFIFKPRDIDLDTLFINYRYEMFYSYQEAIDSLIIRYLLYIHPLRFLNTFVFSGPPSEQIIENFTIFYLIFGIALHFLKLYIKKTK